MKGVFTLSAITGIAVILLLVTGIGATVFVTPAYAQGPGTGTTSPPDMTGHWLGDDGGTYYLRQIGDVVWWVGLSGGNDGRTYSNTFRGTMTTQSINNEQINVISGEYVDVPRGHIKNSGKLLLHVSAPTTIQKISGQFGTEKWSKLLWSPPPPIYLTGVWQANDGGTYYLRHNGLNVWWNGMSGGNDGRTFNNVFRGEIKWLPNEMRISGEWIDLPRGTHMHSGTLDLRIVDFKDFAGFPKAALALQHGKR
jgi:hypothetical protein